MTESDDRQALIDTIEDWAGGDMPWWRYYLSERFADAIIAAGWHR